MHLSVTLRTRLVYAGCVNLREESMTITLDIRPEVQAELARQAAAQGCPIEAVATTLLEEAVRLPATSPSKAAAKDMVDLFAPLRGLNIDFERDRDPGRDIRL